MTKATWEAAHIMARYIKDETVRWNDFDKVVCPPEKNERHRKPFRRSFRMELLRKRIVFGKGKSNKGRS